MQTKSNQGVSSLATAFGLITCSRLIHYFVDLKSETKNLHTAVHWNSLLTQGYSTTRFASWRACCGPDWWAFMSSNFKIIKKTSEMVFSVRNVYIYLHLWWRIINPNILRPGLTSSAFILAGMLLLISSALHLLSWILLIRSRWTFQTNKFKIQISSAPYPFSPFLSWILTIRSNVQEPWFWVSIIKPNPQNMM